MNDDEKKVLDYLKGQGFSNIEFEPDGNQPPDFLVDHRIAVEARRLNQFFQYKDRLVPLEDLEHSLEPKLESLFRSFDSMDGTKAAFVLYHYSRPLKFNEKLSKEIQKVLVEQYKHIDVQKEYLVLDKLYMTFFPTDKKDERVFLFGSKYDQNKGGAIVAETLKSLEIVIEEKRKLIENFKHKYDEWWLALVNHVYHDFDRVDRQQLRRGFKRHDFFNKVILISQHETGKGFEL